MKLPQGIRVLERGWLSCNNILLDDTGSATLVDSGYGAHAQQTLALLDQALSGTRLGHLVNTHCHSDHIGGNAAIRRRHACRVSIPEGEAPLIDAWDEAALILSIADQRAERFDYDATITPGEILRMGGFDWQAITAPGHDNHALMYWCADERILISGDALWENGFGVVFPHLFGDERAFEVVRTTLDRIAALGARIVLPGHGRPFDTAEAALERAFTRIESFRADPERHARHALKVMLVFALLEKRSLPVETLPGYLDRVPLYGEIDRRFLRKGSAALAEYLVHDLQRAGAVRIERGCLVPA